MPYNSAKSDVIASISSDDISSVTNPDIEMDAISPVIDGMEDGNTVLGKLVGIVDGIELLGRLDGNIVGDTVGAAVMKISQQNP